MDRIRISPSSYSKDKGCFYRFIKATNLKIGYKSIYNRYAFLGILIHNVFESFYLQNWNLDSFEDVWQDELDQLTLSMSESPSLAKIKSESKYYIVKKRQFEDYLSYHQPQKSIEYIPEKPINHSFISGRIDLLKVDRANNNLELIDLKTSRIFNYNKFVASVPIEAYCDQLKLYAFAYIEQSIQYTDVSHFPDIRLTIASTNRHVFWSFKYTFSNHLSIQKEIGSLVSSLKNNKVSDLAEPSESNCKDCTKLGSCQYLLSSLRNEMGSFMSIQLINKADQIINSNLITIEGAEILGSSHITLPPNTKQNLIIAGSLYYRPENSMRYWTQSSFLTEINKYE